VWEGRQCSTAVLGQERTTQYWAGEGASRPSQGLDASKLSPHNLSSRCIWGWRQSPYLMSYFNRRSSVYHRLPLVVVSGSCAKTITVIIIIWSFVEQKWFLDICKTTRGHCELSYMSDILKMFQGSFEQTSSLSNEDGCAAYSGNLWSSQSRTLFSCHLCGAWLGSAQTLRNHVRKKHMALKTERCRLCGERFRWSSQVVRHKRLCHPESL